MSYVIVAGGGPSGMMAAIRSAELGNKVLLLEKNRSLGRKLLLTGKGRCNITNACSLEDFLERFGRKGQFLRDAFKVFFNAELIEFFESRGLSLKTERQGRVFPRSDLSLSVLDVLHKELVRLGVEISLSTRLKNVGVSGKRLKGIVLEGNKRIDADKLILATGGASYAFTGSTGQGYKIAEDLGHTVQTLRPALVPLAAKKDSTKYLEGLSLKNVQIVFSSSRKRLKSGIGEMMFTDIGVSGPLVLSLSGDVVDMKTGNFPVFMDIDLKPALSLEQLERRFLRAISSSPRKNIHNLLRDFLPARSIKPFLEQVGMELHTKSSDIKSQHRKKLVACLKGWRFEIKGAVDMDKAMVTRGGIDLKQIDPKTMQSRLIENLYFCGEILDLDADTGGFNLQQAFSTGFLAGSS
jgi:predicted Rossmann fold flavoprotein